jgi:hypothetical protein
MHLSLKAATALVLILGSNSVADYTPRQYYGAWHRHPTRPYHYRHYYFKPTADYAGYRHHYAVFYPARPQHVYFYNPYKRVFWGRCPADAKGKPAYSLLAEKDRKDRIEDIPDAAFPKPGALPPIPESKDGGVMDLPPDDLPDSALPGDRLGGTLSPTTDRFAAVLHPSGSGTPAASRLR